MFLFIDAKGAIPRFPDAYVNSLGRFGYAYVSGGIRLFAEIHRERDSQYPGAWYWHIHTVSAGSFRVGNPDNHIYCFSFDGPEILHAERKPNIVIADDTMRIMISSSWSDLISSNVDVVASFTPSNRCPPGSDGFSLLHQVGL